MTDDEYRKQAAATDRRLEQITGRIAAMAEALERMEGRLDTLHQECQRTAGAAQRMLLKQESLSNGVGRVEEALRGR